MTNISINKLHEFKDHPYKVLDNDEMNNLIESVQEHGIMSPLIVRPLEGTTDQYEIISGHRRFRAAQKAGLTEVPAFIRPVSRDEAAIMLVDSNLHREHILPSEKAFAYKMRLEAMKRQGQRTDLTSVPVAQKSTSRAELGKAVGESQDQVRRYIRLTNLIPPLLDMVDEGRIAMRPAVELSYLPENEQTTLHEMMELEDCTPSHAQTIKMRQFSENGKPTEEVILSIMQEEKPNQKEQFRMPRERISKYFPTGTPAQKIEDTIVKALDMYYKRQRSMER